jgi:uncharacterized protein
VATRPSTRITRQPARGRYDRETVDAILDEALVCHLGIVVDGHPVVIPTLQARVDDILYLHGSAASRTLRALSEGVPASVAVTLVDGLVLARSVFHHSVNYRSAVVFGTARAIDAPEEKLRALERFVEKLVPGRWADARRPTEQELKATTVLALPLDAASAKIREGAPSDDEGDLGLPVWAGVLPLRTTAGPLEAAPDLPAGIELPSYLRALVDDH